MTKKDYIALARLIKAHSTYNVRTLASGQDCSYTSIHVEPFLMELCDILKADNPNFDEAKFRKAIS